MKYNIFPISLVAFFLLMTSTSVFAQNKYNTQWKNEKHNLQLSFGTAHLYSDLGGGSDINEQTLTGLNFFSSRANLGFGYNLRLERLWNFKTGFNYAWLAGSDKYTKQENRKERGLSVETMVFELCAQIEFYITVQEEVKYVRGQMKKGFPFTSYIFGGLCGFAYVPMAMNDGKLVRLRPLGTEGQNSNSLPTRTPYSVLSWGVPFGVGFKYDVNEKIGLGLEWGIRWCFTDYLDDVSRSYAPVEAFGTNKDAIYFGTLCADHTYPETCTKPSHLAGEQRGNPNNDDAYMFINFSVYFKIGDKGGYRKTSIPNRYHRF